MLKLAAETILYMYVLQGNVIEFPWSNITLHDVNHDVSSFYFQYEREGKKPRIIKVFTPHVSILDLLYLNLL